MKSQATTQEIIDEREKSHGDWVEQSNIAQSLKAIAENGRMFRVMTFQQRESLDMILTKISRIVSGDSGYPDHWKDISGYAELAIISGKVSEKVNRDR